MVELDNGHQQEFECKLAEALADMRNQHELQIKMYKDEIEKTYNTKVDHQVTVTKGLLCSIYVFCFGPQWWTKAALNNCAAEISS